MELKIKYRSKQSQLLDEKRFQLFVQTMASFETSTGMSCEKAVEQNDTRTKDIVAQYWERKSEV